MNKLILQLVGAFIGGAVFGGTISYIVTKRYCEYLVEDEINKILQDVEDSVINMSNDNKIDLKKFADNAVSGLQEGFKDINKTASKMGKAMTDFLGDMPKPIISEEYLKKYKDDEPVFSPIITEAAGKSSDDNIIYLISGESYYNDCETYDKIDIIYYHGDKQFAESNDDIIDDISIFDWARDFGDPSYKPEQLENVFEDIMKHPNHHYIESESNEEGYLYVRNDDLETDFCIRLVPGSYKEMVMGIEEED